MKRNKEYRAFNSGLSLEPESRKIEGLIPYDSISEDLGFFELLSPGCFTKTLQESKDIRCLYGHDDNQLLARTKNGSLTFVDGTDGLHFFFEAPDTQLGNDVLTMVRSELISGCSFGFYAINEKIEVRNGERVRVVTEAKLIEVSLVGSPAYSESSVHARNEETAAETPEKSEESETTTNLESEATETKEPELESVTDPEPPLVEETNQPIDQEQLKKVYDQLLNIEKVLNTRGLKYGI